ncbi:hypothetical protein AAAC51_09700 [Priestia megaterium]
MLWILPFCIMLFQRFLIDRSAQQKGLLFCTMPASAIVLMLLMNHSMKRERKSRDMNGKEGIINEKSTNSWGRIRRISCRSSSSNKGFDVTIVEKTSM